MIVLVIKTPIVLVTKTPVMLQKMKQPGSSSTVLPSLATTPSDFSWSSSHNPC